MSTSVIVVSYNSRPYLAACLEAICAQLGPEDELIVVDNGSSDGSVALVAAQFPSARLICGPNTGYAGGNNRGANAANGTYLVFLNPDTVVRSGALAALLAPLKHEPDVGLTTACLLLGDQPETINACGNTMHYTGLTYCRGAGQARTAYTRPADVDAISGAAFAIRRELFCALGGLDERFFMYVEDSDLSLRARIAGYRIRYVPEALVEHHYTMKYSPSKAFYLERNRHLMLLKNLHWPTYIRLLPGLLLSELVTGGYLLMRGPAYWTVKPRVYAWLWRNRWAITRSRKHVATLRRQSDETVLASMSDHLEFEQVASHWLASLSSRIFNPIYRLMRPIPRNRSTA
ncbi:glycosyltransferase family 2 protein [Candidatus Chloroploca asiatica]|uniref:Glycosyltransferase 2-like domain-containing protein n=1 Tax=Candidatus Chloroploca asiatica TaxID=1506545 RepID=A0A2H3KYL6_9CHLR|nr:glycosyltransferase family 2 protein [Candidatus Chloroploca asiatica]PDV99088.1 hypothetical protein A9Q02_13475 [Candidatus Chloroploca asiatica]